MAGFKSWMKEAAAFAKEIADEDAAELRALAARKAANAAGFKERMAALKAANAAKEVSA